MPSGYLRAILQKVTVANPNYSESAAGTIHGLARHGNVPLHLRNEVMQALQNAATGNGTTDTARGSACQAAMGMAHLVGKDEESFLASHPDVVRDLVMVTKLACQNKHYAGHQWGVGGMFSPILVVSDANKKVLVESGYLDIVLHVLCTLYRDENAAVALMARLTPGLDMAMHKKAFPHGPGYGKNPDSLRLYLQLVVQLSFSSQVVQRLRQLMAALDPVLKLVGECETDKRNEVLSLLQQLRFILDVSEQETDLLVTPPPQGHIMISYSWAQQNAVRAFAEQLKNRGYTVWIDLDQMAGDTVEKMAAAVEDAKAVVMCVSQEYKESHNCRLEAMYANQLKKPIIPIKLDEYKPNGWLGILMGVKLYYDGTQPEEAAEEVSHKELRSLFGSSLEQPTSITLTDGTKSSINVSVKSWDNSRVLQWLEEIGFGVYAEQLERLQINGKALLELKHIRNVDPLGFNSLLRNEDHFFFGYGDALSFGQEIAKLC